MVGVDLAENMIAEAQRIEDLEESLGIQYFVGDATTFRTKTRDVSFDLVTMEYVLNCAPTKKTLRQFFETAFHNLVSGGRFFAVTNVLEGAETHQFLPSHCEFDPLDVNKDGSVWFDGCKAQVCHILGLHNLTNIVQVTIKDDEGVTLFSVVNTLWSIVSMKTLLLDTGFKAVEIYHFNVKPSAIIIATK